MPVSVLEATRDIVLAYIEKYPLSTSAYSANIEQTMQRLRSDALDFAKEVYRELQRLEDGDEALPAPDDE